VRSRLRDGIHLNTGESDTLGGTKIECALSTIARSHQSRTAPSPCFESSWEAVGEDTNGGHTLLLL
jgi:hypothetical protein